MIPIGTNVQLSRFPKVTVALILANTIFFIIETILPLDSLKWLIENFGFGPETLLNPLSVVTSMFLHGGIYHIASNMFFLWIFGGPVEEKVGSGKYLLYYFGAGLAANLLDLAMKYVSGTSVVSIGASGAISGIMGIYLYRCFYTKVRMVISPILIPWQINIPAAPLILLWFLQDIIGGIISLSYNVKIGYWAHIGGFLFGLAISRINRYGHEGRVEQLREKILKRLEAGDGWKTAEKELLKLLEVAPDDPEVNQDLARLYAQEKQMKRAENYYQISIQRYFLKDPLSAAYTVLEFLDTMSKPMALQYHLRAGEALVENGFIEDAYRALNHITKEKIVKNAIYEKALVLFCKICQSFGKNAEALEVYEIFMESFPESRNKDLIKGIIAKDASEIFPPQKTALSTASDISKKNKEELEQKGMYGIMFFETVVKDPAFWLLLLFSNIAFPIFFFRYYGEWTPVWIFIGAFVMTIIHRMGSISEIILDMGRPSEKQARREVDLKRCYDDALMAEKRSQFDEAATLYENFLFASPSHIQARFNLARLYHNRLSQSVNARKHYRLLMQYLNQDHPYYRDAVDALKIIPPK